METSDDAEDKKLALESTILDAVEYIPVEEEGEVKVREKKLIEEGDDDEEPEEDFEWMQDLKNKDPDSL